MRTFAARFARCSKICIRQRASIVLASLLASLSAIVISPLASADQSVDVSKLKRNDALFDALPQKIKDAKIINAATESDYPPFEFLDEKNELVGADIEISEALGRILGVPIKNINTGFAGIIPGIQAGRFDIGVSSMGDYTTREKVVDFVDYYRGGTSVLVPLSRKAPEAMKDFCGMAVGALKGTSAETQAQATSKYCTDNGLAAVDVNAYPSQNDAILALRSGRIQLVSGDSATNGYSAKNPSLQIRNVPLSLHGDRPYYGIAMPKDSPLVEPMMQGMKILIDSGVYTAILAKWGIADGAIPAPLKNHPSAQ